MSPWNYSYAGLQIVSELLIPEWAVFEQADPFFDPDVKILLADPQPCPETENWPESVTPEEYRFSIPEAGRYQVVKGREIILTPALTVDDRAQRLFLLGSAWGALCYQRGILALHMSVVQVGERAAAFCGMSGAGKSSLAAGLVARGYPLIGDDLCCFDLSHDVPRVYPSAPRLKLWRDALSNLGWQEDRLVRDHYQMDKFHLMVPLSNSEDNPSSLVSAAATAPLPLGAIFLLEWGDLGLKRLSGLNALRSLVASATYRGECIEPLGHTGAYWQQCARLARATPIWELKRPPDWSQMNTVLDWVTAKF